MKSHDLISVIIPVYNTYHYFEKCIKSVINQTYSNLEIIIINDDSTDKVEDIILKYKNIDRRIQYLKNLKNLGVGRTRNIGLEVAKGQYIYFLDSDDYIEENCIEEMYKAIKAIESVEDYARKKNKYNELYEALEFASVSHILIGTINRIVKIKDYKQKDIDRCIMWINNKYPNWKENRYVKKLILSNSKMLNYFEKYKLIK